MKKRPGRLNTVINATPRSTPGMRNGSHKAALNRLNGRPCISATAKMREAPANESQQEFQMADCPAASALGNSIHVRLTVNSSIIGRAAASRATAIVTTALDVNKDNPI